MYTPTTQHFYVLYEVVSALQKTIRRGDEEAAMFWALELLPKYERYLWRRLTVIANEDVGLADPFTVQFVSSQRQSWFFLRQAGAKDECRLVLANVILALCRSFKSQLADHFQCVVTDENQTQRHEVPDFALNKHTSRGKRMGRDMQHFLDEGAQLHPASQTTDDPYSDVAREIWLAGRPQPSEWPPYKKNGGDDDDL